MRNRIIYGILKAYKGIFVKKHIGNVQILMLEMGKSFWVLNMLGIMEDSNDIVCQLILRAPAEYANEFIDEFEETENFVQLEEMICNIPKENEDSFKVVLKKKGRYLNSHYTISFSPEYSQGDVRIYMIKGKIKFVEDDFIKGKAQLKMKALKKRTIAKPLISKFLASMRSK